MSFETRFSKICRTCLVENNAMKSVFSVEEFMEQQIPLSDILMSFTSLQVLKGDGLPEQVCIQCAQEINRAFTFRKLCERSDVTLRDCLQNLILQTPVEPELESYFLKKGRLREQNESFNEDTLCKPEVYTNDINNMIDDKDILAGLAFDDCNDNNEDDIQHETLKSTKKRKDNLENNSKKNVYPCKQCDTFCFGLGEYRRHISEVHGNHKFKCDTCGKEFRSQQVLTRHLLTHRSIESNKTHSPGMKKCKNKTGIIKKRNLPRTCNICNKTFRFHSNLERHKLIHTGEKPYLCNVCGKGFAQLSYLKIHSFIHTGEKPYKCKMCDRSFAAPGTLMTHIRTHTGERPHVCKICGKDFPQSGYLSAHIRTHTGEKPVECKVCHRRFNQSGRLIIHMRIHSGEKPYNCVECGRSFAVKGTLKKHIRTHTGERPYICSVCGQAFAQSGTLATHMKVHKPK